MLIFFILSLVLSGCTEKQFIQTDKEEEQGKLLIYTRKYDEYMNEIIAAYERKYNDVDVEKVIFEDYQSYKDTLVKDIMVGEGPDVILFDGWVFNNIVKTMDTGAFYDLNEFITSDENFDLDELSEPVLSCGQYEQKQYFIPINYFIPMLITTKGIKEEFGFEYDKKATIDDLLGIMRDINVERDDIQVLSSRPFIQDIFNGRGKELYDLNTKQVTMDRKDIKNTIEEYLALDNYVDGEMYSYDFMKSADDLSNKELVFFNPYRYNVSDLMFLNSYIMARNERKIELYSFPKAEQGSGLVATPRECIAINSRTKMKQEAYNFIKMAINEGYQQSESMDYIPINNKALEGQLKENLLSGRNTNIDNYTFTVRTLPQDLQEQFMEMVEGVTICKWTDTVMYSYLYESVSQYKEGGYTLEEALDNAEQKMKLYLNE